MRFEIERFLVLVAAAALSAWPLVAQQQPAPSTPPLSRSVAPYGFTAESAAKQQTLEERFLALPAADRARDFHRYLTDKPHVAGSDRNRHLAEWMRDLWKEYGLDTVEISIARAFRAGPGTVTRSTRRSSPTRRNCCRRLAEAIETGEASKVRAQIDRLVTVLDRVAKTLAP